MIESVLVAKMVFDDRLKKEIEKLLRDGLSHNEDGFSTLETDFVCCAIDKSGLEQGKACSSNREVCYIENAKGERQSGLSGK